LELLGLLAWWSRQKPFVSLAEAFGEATGTSSQGTAVVRERTSLCLAKMYKRLLPARSDGIEPSLLATLPMCCRHTLTAFGFFGTLWIWLLCWIFNRRYFSRNSLEQGPHNKYSPAAQLTSNVKTFFASATFAPHRSHL